MEAASAIARGAVQEAVTQLAPSDGVVSQQVHVGPDDIAIQIISTKQIPAAKITPGLSTHKVCG